MHYFVGAYASSPNTNSWDPELETKYYNDLKELPHIKGLEHPYINGLHPYDDAWFLDNIDPCWNFTITCIPGIMTALGDDAQFGIASDDQCGRDKALSFMKGVHTAVIKLNNHLGRAAVQAVQIQTAPNRQFASSSVEALCDTLKTMLSWNWQGAKLLIEHCDTFIEGKEPSKGFLTLAEEIAAIRSINHPYSDQLGIVINWGRSVYEERNTQGAIKHITLARKSGLLKGIMFSGISDKDTEFGAWQDSHMPPAKSTPNSFGADGSWLTEAEIHRSLAACEACELTVLGIKLGIRPSDTTIDDRIGFNRDALLMLERFTAEK